MRCRCKVETSKEKKTNFAQSSFSAAATREGSMESFEVDILLWSPTRISAVSRESNRSQNGAPYSHLDQALAALSLISSSVEFSCA